MKKYTSWIAILVIIAVIIGGIVWYSNQPGQYDGFAACIKESNAKFYGAFWCTHCQDQKALFGKSAKNLPYVECSTPDGQGQTQICKDNKIESYPTWQLPDGTLRVGTMTFEELASSTDCKFVKDNQ
jgi:thiol-disulfide isomerase/thioredoxin